jgi:hypothetical protein
VSVTERPIELSPGGKGLVSCSQQSNIIAKAAEYTELLKVASLPAEAREFRKLEQSYLTLAENDEWMADNLEKINSPGADENWYGDATVENVMLQGDPWEKAADCERALRLTLDPIYRENLTNIREFWISLAHKRPFLSETQFAGEAEAIGRFHANLSATASMH